MIIKFSTSFFWRRKPFKCSWWVRIVHESFIKFLCFKWRPKLKNSPFLKTWKIILLLSFNKASQIVMASDKLFQSARFSVLLTDRKVNSWEQLLERNNCSFRLHSHFYRWKKELVPLSVVLSLCRRGREGQRALNSSENRSTILFTFEKRINFTDNFRLLLVW